MIQLYQAELEAERDRRNLSPEAMLEQCAATEETTLADAAVAAESPVHSGACSAAATLTCRVLTARSAAAVVLLTIFLAALAVLWVNQSQVSRAIDGDTHCVLPSNVENFDWTNRSQTVAPAISFTQAQPAVPLDVPLSNVTATVQRMQRMGRERLQHSDCPEAAMWFAYALQLLSSNSSVNLTVIDRARLQADRGFALVCAQKFNEGAKVLEQHHLSDKQDLSTGDPHLVNALGYAHFKMRDFKRAAEVFAAGARADPANMIFWNNLAAAKMAHGDLKAADDAMFIAAETYQSLSDNLDEYRKGLFVDNLLLLTEKAQGRNHTRLPTVELWIP